MLSVTIERADLPAPIELETVVSVQDDGADETVTLTMTGGNEVTMTDVESLTVTPAPA